MDQSKCACLAYDEVVCSELRTYGYSPVTECDYDPEECVCVCHTETDELDTEEA